MFWTHIYDLVMKIGVLFLSIIILHNIPFLEDKGIVVTCVSLIISVVSYILFLRTLGSYLYCRLSLKMPINFKQAEALNEALAPNPFPFTNLLWLPLKEVKDLHVEHKYETAIALLYQWKLDKQRKREEQINQSKNNSPIIKGLERLSVVIVLASFATSFLKLPPATFVIQYYCNLFDTNEYSPFFISCIMTIVCLLPIILIKRKLENKTT